MPREPVRQTRATRTADSDARAMTEQINTMDPGVKSVFMPPHFRKDFMVATFNRIPV